MTDVTIREFDRKAIKGAIVERYALDTLPTLRVERDCVTASRQGQAPDRLPTLRVESVCVAASRPGQAYDPYGRPYIRESMGRGDMNNSGDATTADGDLFDDAVSKQIWDPRADLDDDGDIDEDDVDLFASKSADWESKEGMTVAQALDTLPTLRAGSDFVAASRPGQAFSDVGNPFMFQGRPHFAIATESDDEVATFMLNDHRNRFEEPVIGRWLTRDPVGYLDGMNLYEAMLSNLYTGLDPMGLESFRQLVEEGTFDPWFDLLWHHTMIHGNEKAFWIYKFNARTKFISGYREAVWPGNPPRGVIGHVHTHPQPHHDRGPSQQDREFAEHTGKPGVVLIRDPKNPKKKYIVVIYGPGVDEQIPCASIFGRPPPGVHYETDSTGHCISVVDDENKFKKWLNRQECKTR